jgi:hypothetical protein
MTLFKLLKKIDENEKIIIETNNPINQGNIIQFDNKNKIDLKYINCKVKNIFVSEFKKVLTIKIDFRDWEY